MLEAREEDARKLIRLLAKALPQTRYVLSKAK